MTDTILASAYMSEVATDNGPAFSTFLQAVVSQKKIGVIDGKYNIQTPQVFTGLGQFTLISSEPNKIDKGQGPELNYTGSVTDQPLFKFIGCENNSIWGEGKNGITINLLNGAKYGINMHVSNTAGEHDYSLHQWSFINTYINYATDGGASWRLTGDINNDTHIWYECGGYPGNHINGVKTVTANQTGTLSTNTTYYNVPIGKASYCACPARATIVVSSGLATATITNLGVGFAISDTLVIQSGYADSANLLADISSSGVTLTFTVASILTDMDINSYPFSNESSGYTAPRISVANYNSYTPWVIGNAIPTTGTWATGQTVLNWTAAGGYGSPIGWYCSAGGTPGTWIPLPYGLGSYGLGDPLKGAALVEVDNWNSVGLVMNLCNFNQGAQGMRMMRGRARIYDCNYGPNTDVDIFQQSQVIVRGGWTEQSCRFIFEPNARTFSTVNVTDMKIASYPYWFAAQNGFSQQATDNKSFSPIWTKRWDNIAIINSTLEGDTTIPKRLMVLVDSDKPPVATTTSSHARVAGTYSDTYGAMDNDSFNIIGYFPT